ncbi:MAG: hypothetical protein JNK50_00505 [Bacteroidia bacterium]|nr:hypothetical protein [Bacteroidia bacterium]
MRHIKTILTLLTFLFLVDGCVPDENDVGVVADYPNVKKSEKFYSPDKRRYVTIYETVFDSTESKTQVVLNFETTGAGIYSVKGINKGLKVYWADNSTIVIETKKEYESRQKLEQVQSFDDLIKINYIDK